MAAETPLFLVRLVGFATFLWLGLYVLSRGERGTVALLTGLTALAAACFFGSGALLVALYGAPPATWRVLARATWWAAVAPLPLWLHLSLRLAPPVRWARWRRHTLWLSYGAGIALIGFGTFTDVVRGYIGPGPHVPDPDPAGPAYIAYTLYLLLCTGAALLQFVRLVHPAVLAPAGFAHAALSLAPAGTGPIAAGVPLGKPVAGATSVMLPVASGLTGEDRLLVVGALCFVCGASYESLRVLLHTHWNELLSYAVIIVGLGAASAAVAVRSTLLLGVDVRRDVLYNATGLALLVVPYLVISAVLVGFSDAQHRLFALLIVGLITGGHTLYDKARDWLDKIFFPPVVQEERAAARAYVEALATQPIGPSPELATRKAFDDAVRRALTHLSDPTKLATTPLLSLQIVAQGVAAANLEDTRLNRAPVLKGILLELLEGLRPADQLHAVTADAYRFYNCLYYPYMRGINRRRAPTVLRELQERRRRDGSPRSDLERVVQWMMQVDEDTFYKWQRRGSDTIAAALRDGERAAGGAVPEDWAGVSPSPVPSTLPG